MWRRVPWKVWIGIGLILLGAGLFGGSQWWMATRTWVPLEMPISLAKGHIRSPEFKINVDGAFWIWVEVETQAGDEDVSCLIGYRSDYCEKNNVRELQASWTLSRSGKVTARGPTDRWPAVRGGTESKAHELGRFVVPSGDHYVLDVDIPEDYSRFDMGHPGLAIITMDYRLFENGQPWVFLFSTLLGVMGIAMVLHALAVWVRKKHDYQSISLTFPGPLPHDFVFGSESLDAEGPKPRWFSLHRWVWVALLAAIAGICGYMNVPLEWIAGLGIVGASLFALGWAARFAPQSKALTLGISPNHNQNIQWAQRLPLRPPISRMPGFGVIAATTFGFLAFMFMILAPLPYKGLRVHLLKPGETPAKPDAWTEPLVVTAKDNGVGRDPKLFVGSKEVAWDDLDAVMKRELASRKDWVVYVGGDDTIPYQSVALVIDAARGRGAKVILITGKK